MAKDYVCGFFCCFARTLVFFVTMLGLVSRTSGPGETPRVAIHRRRAASFIAASYCPQSRAASAEPPEQIILSVTVLVLVGIF